MEGLLDQYGERKHLYERYCQAVANMMANLLEDRGYKYHLQWRVKEPESLLRKARRKQPPGKPPLALADIDDVAGVRVILYIDSDRKSFVREVRREFSGTVRLRNKKKRSGYEATHLIVALGEKRLRLSEYKKFEGLKCEIQVTSILKHAWSEIEHDIFYKPYFETAGDAQRLFAVERKKIRFILDHHIKKANDEFEKIVRVVRRRTGAARSVAGQGAEPASSGPSRSRRRPPPAG